MPWAHESKLIINAIISHHSKTKQWENLNATQMHKCLNDFTSILRSQLSMAANDIQPNHRMDLAHTIQAIHACSENQNINKLNMPSLFYSDSIQLTFFCSIMNFSIKSVAHLTYEIRTLHALIRFD